MTRRVMICIPTDADVSHDVHAEPYSMASNRADDDLETKRKLAYVTEKKWPDAEGADVELAHGLIHALGTWVSRPTSF